MCGPKRRHHSERCSTQVRFWCSSLTGLWTGLCEDGTVLTMTEQTYQRLLRKGDEEAGIDARSFLEMQQGIREQLVKQRRFVTTGFWTEQYWKAIHDPHVHLTTREGKVI